MSGEKVELKGILRGFEEKPDGKKRKNGDRWIYELMKRQVRSGKSQT
jgi:hypothetical protein